MYKRIMVAVDDSDTSQKALAEAVSLAGLHHAVLEIVHAVDESMLQTFSSHGVTLVSEQRLQHGMFEAGSEVLQAAVATAESAGLKPLSRLLISEDLHPADLIAQAVGESAADLLVVGSHGRRGFQRLILGSVAERLVRKIDVSILIVRCPTCDH